MQQTFERYRQIVPLENIYITTHTDYKELVRDMLPEVDDAHIIAEEERRNTAPSIAYASHVIEQVNPHATVVVAPCDHLILKTEEFKEAILKGLGFAERNDKLLTIGIKPSRPETGDGYIQIDDEENEGFFKVKTFIEKPAREFAEIFIQSDEFFRNSGIFIWNLHTIKKAFHEYMAEICPRVDCDVPDFTSCPNISIDYSIMEKADNVYVQLCDFGWADLGTWESLYEALPKDKARNVAVNDNAVLYNCKDTIVSLPEGKLAVVQGLEGYLVAMRNDVVLVCKKDDQNAIRKFVNDVEMKFGEKFS